MIPQCLAVVDNDFFLHDSLFVKLDEQVAEVPMTLGEAATGSRSLPVAPAPTMPHDDSAHRPQKNWDGEPASIAASLAATSSRRVAPTVMNVKSTSRFSSRTPAVPRNRLGSLVGIARQPISIKAITSMVAAM